MAEELYSSLSIDDIRASYESVLADGISKESIIDCEGNIIYKRLKEIAEYAFRIFRMDKFTKNTFFDILDRQSHAFYKYIDEKEKDFEVWTCECDFLSWVISTYKVMESE